MFRHPDDQAPAPKSSGDSPKPKLPLSDAPAPQPPKDASPAALRDLLEKNLKWSQIIYEQNRKINNKLLWAAVADWLRLLIIAVPFILAAWFLPPIVKELYARYQQIFQFLPPVSTSTPKSTSSAQDILKILPLNADQQTQLKAILGK